MTNLELNHILMAHLAPELRQSSQRLHQAMMHWFKHPGKLFRAQLLLACHEAHAPLNQNAYQAALALECIHAFSLIHDDLPDMDNATLRRHQPTVHQAYDPAHAILAGDALMNLGFEIIAHMDIDPNTCVKLMQRLTLATGHRGMTLGQSLDIQQPHSAEALLACYTLKTGALIEAACHMGLMTAHVTCPEKTNRILEIARIIGLTFQLRDDLKDFNQVAATSKTPQPDAANLLHHWDIKILNEKIDTLDNELKSLLETLTNPKPLYRCLAITPLHL